MANNSKIEWTEATWNPIIGCSIVSPGCTNCYAMKMAARCEAMGISRYDGTTNKVNGNTVWTGRLNRAPADTLLAPLKRRKPTIYFVNSMGDLFHEDCPDEWIDEVFAVMALSPQHTFQVLTKRARRMHLYMTEPDRFDRVLGARDRIVAAWDSTISYDWPARNVWLGVSTERQKEADERIPHLLQTPATVRFISAEPLLGPIDLTLIRVKLGSESWMVRNALYARDSLNKGSIEHHLDWVIVGGESGRDARPTHPDWIRSLRDQCKAADVPFFFKQWGEWWEVGSDSRDPETGDHHRVDPDEDGIADGFDRSTDCLIAQSGTVFREPDVLPPELPCRWMTRLGKRAAGRILDGIEHNAMPHQAA